MTDRIVPRTNVEIELDKLKQIVKDVSMALADADMDIGKILDNLNDRLTALEGEGGIVPILSKMEAHLNMVALSLMQQGGMIHVDISEDGNFLTRIPSPEERETMMRPAFRTIPVMPSTLHGDGGPMQWVFTCPAPYNDVSILCSPDTESPIGMRCHVERKVRGGDRQKFSLHEQEMP